MAIGSFATIRDLKSTLIRKPLAGAVVMAPTSVAVPAAFFEGTASDITDLKALGFESVGHVSKANAPKFSPETETADVDAWGLLEAARTDMISRKTTISWTGLETHRLNLELFHNVDLSAVTPDATTGETAIVDPTDPSITYHRFISIAVDGAGANRIFILKVAPRFVVTQVAEQQYDEKNALEYGITGRAMVDEVAGYAVKTVFGGPGWKALTATAGF